MLGGPYDGAEVDPWAIFGEQPPARLAMPRGGVVAQYELGRDGAGRYYRFAGWRDREPRSPLRRLPGT